ncbi:putative F-box/FBD/LRR-repeat protein At3g49030 [Gossypium arboreum]|uniref:putative F-box/FBD/LRR-repeat protein At3g49030 n=1 Tax=Gossypium arboreum TaxID=29729 RepID=UPI000818F758|nr:putative F-box/FBD/LRR-repeat protein At3g49030 [Gossypium arboreum]
MARIKTTLELEDRLSDLPDCLLHHIFGFIDFKYCIRTSVLSKRWKLLWTSLSNLYFDGCDGTRLPDFHRFVLEALFRRGRHHNKYPLNEVRLHLMWMGTHSSFLKKNIAHLESHNVRCLGISFDQNLCNFNDQDFPARFSRSQVLKTLELTRCHIRPSESDCKPTWTNLNLHECDFCPQIMFFNPFENCLHLKELRLHKCSVSGKAVLNISCPRLVNLVLTDLKVHTRDPVDDKFKLIILAPQPVSFSLTLNRPLNFTALHLPALDNVEIQIRSPNNFKTLSFSRLITMLQGLRYARSVIKVEKDERESGS